MIYQWRNNILNTSNSVCTSDFFVTGLRLVWSATRWDRTLQGIVVSPSSSPSSRALDINVYCSCRTNTMSDNIHYTPGYLNTILHNILIIILLSNYDNYSPCFDLVLIISCFKYRIKRLISTILLLKWQTVSWNIPLNNIIIISAWPLASAWQYLLSTLNNLIVCQNMFIFDHLLLMISNQRLDTVHALCSERFNSFIDVNLLRLSGFTQ